LPTADQTGGWGNTNICTTFKHSDYLVLITKVEQLSVINFIFYNTFILYFRDDILEPSRKKLHLGKV